MTSSRGGVEALLLAAGRGDRLRPLTDVLPKPALPLPGAPLGAWMLEALLAHFGSVVVNCSHLAPLLISQLALEGRTEILREQPDPYGTGGTLAALRDRAGQRILVANADIVCDVDLGALLAAHAAAGAQAMVAVEKVATGADFELGEGGKVTGFIDRRSDPQAAGGRFIGVSVYERSALESLPDHRPAGLGESLLAPLVRREELQGYVHEGYVLDVGTRERYARACWEVVEKTSPPPPEGPYEVGRGRFVERGRGRAFVGTGAVVDGEIGPGSVIFAGARVEPGATVDRAIVWPGETVPAGTRLSEAVWFGGEQLSLK